MLATVGKISNLLLSALAGVSAFLFTLLGFLLLTNLDEQVAASILAGTFAVMVVWMAAERPNSAHARAVRALIDRLLAVEAGDLTSPAPAPVRKEMPALASAVEGLFEQVRHNLDHAQAMAMYDPVTSLPNRLHFRREAERVLKARTAHEQAALLFIDLDGFKEVNDRLGHAQGDHVLVMVANRLRVVVRAEARSINLTQPLLARLAGDEFTILLPAVANSAEAKQVAERALAALCEPFKSDGHVINMAASIGVAVCPDHAADLAGLMKAADVAMYHAKASGRGRVCLYDPALTAAAEGRASTRLALRRALENGDLELAYRARLCARTGAIAAGEALVRWRTAEGDLRLLDDAIQGIDDNALMSALGDWGVSAAAEALGRWQRSGVSQRMALQIMPRSLERRDFLAKLRAALEAAGPAPWLLELQLGESTVLKSGSPVVPELEALRRDGVSIGLGNFGAGQSNPVRLRNLPLDRVKLDRSLTAEVDVSDSGRTIASAVIHLVHGLGCEAVADGVEREEQLQVLRAIGCDFFQGFAYPEPLAEEEFLELAARGNESALAARLANAS